jgi:hypothetical protein
MRAACLVALAKAGNQFATQSSEGHPVERGVDSFVRVTLSRISRIHVAQCAADLLWHPSLMQKMRNDTKQ